ncbi:hypothetical protein [Staphylococcus gallinarum]|uniref:hypothetical protein n=3 Tax=Staphylococcus gallinarum TaxID=1293 RepID=UPI002DBDC1B5|nr:hypothetical protein [Staphylococcus gallinarum]MEB6237122.1 hypothetical protein [Staphylococcus gallinarum]MEB7038796.1 hypothetical protein [Staphylococcus gallinarum]
MGLLFVSILRIVIARLPRGMGSSLGLDTHLTPSDVSQTIRSSAMMIKLLFKSGVLDQAKVSTKELDALYLDFKKLSNNTAISTTNLDSLYQQTMSVSD